MDTYELIGHRGARALYPENTILGFELTHTLGVNAFELDIAMTSDNVLVVTHDPHLNPDITRLNGKFLQERGPLVSSLTFSELECYDVGRINPLSEYANRFPKQQPFEDLNIPRLADVLWFAKARNLHLTLEVKTFPDHPEWTAPARHFAIALHQVIKHTATFQNVTISSFDKDVLSWTRDIIPGIRTSALSEGEVGKYTIEGSLEYGVNIWSPEFQYLEKSHVSFAHSLGLSVVPWTVNEIQDMMTMLEYNVDGIITDRPDLLLGMYT